MDSAHVDADPRSFWFVGASYGGTDDQTSRFLEEGIWENGYDDKYLDQVRSMRPGEQIAIKSTYTRKHELPFDNRGESVSVMAIKAIGAITENLNDGKRVRVDWTEASSPREPREWYFYTHRGTVWRVNPGEWRNNALIQFAFEGTPQDIDRFRNAPYWRERYGSNPGDQRFRWTEFYEAFAEKLLDHQGARRPLVNGIHDIGTRMEGLSYLQDRFADGRTGPLTDICPFTTMGTFNHDMTYPNRSAIAAEMAKLLDVDVPAPGSFDGIPTLLPLNSLFFSADLTRRGDTDIDALWSVFAAARRFVASNQDEARVEFAAAYNAATNVRGVGWNLSMALYWAHPWDFPSLDGTSRHYIANQLELRFPAIDQATPCNAESYLEIMDDLKARFIDESFPVHSFPELSLAAWIGDESDADPTDRGAATTITDGDVPGSDVRQEPAVVEPYSIDDIFGDGCFLERQEIERLLERLRTRKNLILQGPPGTGKTWLAKRLAFALIGERDERKVRAVQFHPNLSYEDFVRGWRPVGDGKLALADGVFMETLRAASVDPSAKFLVVIEEINRGNPAQIFGELLTLLEADKRSPRDAVELCYPDADGTRRPVHVPENVHVIGTMNIADRSLALVDLALRRRFAFVTLEPSLGEAWSNWVVQECGIDPELVEELRRRIETLNDRIAVDDRLGSQFRVGHSYVTPTYRLESDATRDWFRQVVETEIQPLLEEYWFDSPADAREAVQQLLQGW